MQHIITPAIVEGLAQLAGILLLALVAWVGRALQARTRSEYVRSVVARAMTAVSVAVDSTEQAFLADIRRQRSDGRLTQDEAKAAAQRALLRAKQQLGAAGVAELRAAVRGVDVNEWLAQAVEASVDARKQ